MAPTKKSTRDLLLHQLEGGHAHVQFASAVQQLDVTHAGQRPKNIPYSIWELVEHIRRAQADILEFCTNPDYEQPAWPDDYWPSMAAPSSKEQWQAAIEAIAADKEAMRAIIANPENDLHEPLPQGDGQTLFREALLIVDHTAYHVGQIVTIRRLLGVWDS